jgi:hypothetical protein
VLTVLPVIGLRVEALRCRSRPASMLTKRAIGVILRARNRQDVTFPPAARAIN